MGDVLSRAAENQAMKEREDLASFANGLADGPDLTVNKSIQMFCSLTSSDTLKQHYEKRKMEVGSCAGDLIKKLVAKLGGMTSAPELAGLGAMAVAALIDSFSKSGSSVKDALQCVFAEQKASEVRDQIDECLKRCTMHIKNKDNLRSDIKRIEGQLSMALTKLKNSMLSDGHMSSAALKAWVNGAAFHIQILIHLVRLGGLKTCDPVERLLASYQSDLDPLFTKLREVIEAKCSMRGMVMHMAAVAKFLVDENSQWHAIRPQGNYEKYLEAYYERRYGKQKGEIQKYFSEVRQNLQKLVDQKGFFKV